MADTDPVVGKTILQLDPVTGQIDRTNSYVEIHSVGDDFSKKISLDVLALHGLSAKEVIQITHPEIVTDEDFIEFISGKSAYQLAVADGFEGTEAEWLLNLKGANGEDGVAGKSAYQVAVDAGFQGTVNQWLTSLIGADGENGKSAYDVAVDNGFVGTPVAWLASLKGTPGDQGPDGDSAYEIAVAGGFVGDVSQWLASLKGADGEDGATAVLGNLIGSLDSSADLPPVEEYNNADYFWIGTHAWMNVNGEWVDMGEFRGLPGQDGSGITVLGELPAPSYLPEVGERNGDSWLIGKSMFVWNGARWQEQGQEGLRGPKGDTGVTGAEGKSSFDVVRLAFPEIDTMPKYVEFIRGLQGVKGDTAISFVADGTFATVGELPATGTENHGYLIGVPGTYDFHVWIDGAWVNMGNNVGPKGDEGERGIQGLQGPVGRAMTPKGELANTGLLPPSGNLVGDYYSIDGHFHAWDGADWNDLGLFKGADGEQGIQGPVGQPINPKGELPNEAALPGSGNVLGDGYEIAGYIYVYGTTGFVRMGQWRGVAGANGTNGTNGVDGKNIEVMGTYANVGALPAGVHLGKAAIVEGNPKHVYHYIVDAWVDAGPVGVQGEQGADGKSAYQVAVDAGFVGDVTAWLASLKGAEGDQGIQGKSAYQVAVDGGFVGNEAAWLLSLKGADGTDGDAGGEGDSAYEVAVAAGFVGDVNAWLLSLKGVKGDDGDQGPVGPPINVKGTVANQAALPPVGGAADNDTWITLDNGHAWAKVAGAWVDLGVFRGADGKSAYQIALDNGFVGNEAAWLASLQGPPGDDGTNGTNGTNGDDGVSLSFIGNFADQGSLPAGTLSQVATAAGRVYIHNGTVWVDSGAVGVQGLKGDTGDTGNSAYEVAVQEGFVGDVDAWLLSLVGTTGATGKSLYQDAVDSGLFVGTLAEFIASQKGATGASAREDAIANGIVPPGTTAAEFIDFITGPVGDEGPTGATGDTGPAISIIGELANEAALPGTGVAGTGYAIPDTGSPGTFNCWIWLTETTQWFNLGHVVGAQGPKGDTGARGLQGLRGLPGDKGDQGTLWLVFERDPQALDGRINDYFFNSLTQEFFRKTGEATWASLGHIGGGNLNAPSSDGNRKVMLDGDWVDAPLLNTVPADATGVYQLVNGTWVKFDVYTLAVVDSAFTGSTATVNWNTARQFRIQNTTAGAKTINLTNIPAADRAATVIVKVYGKVAAFNWTLPSGSIRWFDGAAPTFANDITTVVFNWDGTEMVGSVPN